MLDDSAIEFRYRDYTRDPLDVREIRRVLTLLGVPAKAVLRRRDPAFKALGLSGEESDDTLIPLIAEHPTLLQRPIGVKGERAVVGRPPAKLLEL